MVSSLNKYDNLALEASAGTGKTFQLAMRVAGMLLTGVQPKDILCLTYTKKATAEMKDRIIAFINSMADNSAKQSEIDFITPLMEKYAEYLHEEFNQEFIQKKAVQARTNLFTHFSELNIRTIDSFNNNILRIFPFEAGFRPDFNMQSDSEIDYLKSESFYALISTLLHNKVWTEILKNIPQALSISGVRLVEVLKTYADFTAENTIALKKSVDNPPDADTINTLLNNVLDLKQKILEQAKLIASTIDFNSLTKVNQMKAYENLSSNNINELMENALIKTKNIEDAPNFKKYEFNNDTIKAHNIIFGYIQELLILQGRIVTSISLTLGSMLHNKLKEIKKSTNILTYTDISEEVYYMLSEDYSTINKDYLYFRLDGKINHLLIDEFQDTSLSQWLTLKPLAEEAMAGIGQNDKSGSFFYVGDPKQNIYRFRGGSSSLFRMLLKEYNNKLQSKTLDTNYRSGKNIVDVVNIVANKIYNQLGNIFAVYNIDQNAYADNGEGYVEITHSDNKKLEDGTAYYLEYTLRKIKECIEAGYSYKDITILTISNNHGSDILEYLEENNIPVQAETSAKLTSSPVFSIMLALADFIETGDTFSYITYAFTEPKSLSCKDMQDISIINKDKNRIISYVKNMLDSSIFEKILFLSNKLDLQNRFSSSPDFFAVLDIMESAVYGEKNILIFKDRLIKAASDKQTSSAAEKNACTVMTIHKSKGLQFPVVILPNISADIKLNAAHKQLFIADNSKFGDSTLCYTYSSKYLNYIENTDEEKYMEQENSLIMQDSINMLYVGMTRAEQALFINCEISKEVPSSLSKQLNFLLGNNNIIMGELKPVEKDKGHKERKSEIVNVNINKEKSYTTDLAFFNDLNDNGMTYSYEASLFGSCLHDGLYLLEYGKEESIAAAEKFITTRYAALINEKDLNTIKDYFKKVYNNKKWQHLFQGRVFKERRIGINNGLYSVDIYSEFDDKLIIMDYKTGAINHERKEDYKKQLNTYAVILSKLHKKKAECYIFHLDSDIIDVT